MTSQSLVPGAAFPAATVGGHTNGPPENIFAEYFGEPNRPINVNPYELFSRQNFTLPEAYHGRNSYLINIIIRTILDEEMWAGRIALPFRLADSQYEIQWDEIHFDSQLLGPVPEEGVSRLVTQRTTSRRDHYVRYGLAFQLEHGFMTTERGRISYVNNLKQIRNATLDTIYLGVIRAYLHCKTVGAHLLELYGSNPSQSQVRRAVAEELEMWACVQKSPSAIHLTDLRMKRRMRKMGVSPDMWIFPEGMKTYLTNVRQENFNYFIKGPDGPKMFQSGMNDNGQMLDVALDCVIFEAKQFDLPESSEPIDLLTRNQSIGEYVTLQAGNLRGFNDWHKYSTKMRDIQVYNEEKDSFSIITLEQCLHYCMRFGEPTDLSRPGSKRKHDEDGDHKRPFPTNTEGDMFTMEDNTPCKFLGDMQPWALNPQAVTDVTSCLAERILRDAGDFNIVIALNEGVKMCREISDPTNETPYKGLYPGTLVLRDGMPASSTPDRSLIRECELNPTRIPLFLTGLATYQGMKYLADMGASTNARVQEYIDKAKRLVHATDIIYERLGGIGNSVFLDADYQQVWLKRGAPDGRSTLFSNLIFKPLKQIEITGEGEQEQGILLGAEANRPPPSNFADVQAMLIESGFVFSDNSKAAEAFHKVYTDIMKSGESPSNEELILLDQESTLIMQALTRYNLYDDNDDRTRNIPTYILGTLKLIKEYLVTENGFDLIDFHKSTRLVFNGNLDETKDRLNKLYQIGQVANTVLGASEALRNLCKNFKENALQQLLQMDRNAFVDYGATLDADVANRAFISGDRMDQKSYLGIGIEANNVKPGSRMFGSAMDADETTPAGFGMESGESFGAGEPRGVGAMGDFHDVGGQRLDFRGVPSYGGGNRGRAAVEREEQLRRDQATAILRPFSDEFKERFAYYASGVSAVSELHRIIAQAFLGLPITLGNLKKLLLTDVPFPFGFICFRPFMTYRMASGILAVKGSTTGETLIGHANFQLGDDPVQKMHVGNFTMYEKSIVYKPHHVAIASNIYAQGYVGGNDCKFYSNRNQLSKNKPDHVDASIFSCIVPYETTNTSDGHMQSVSDFPNPMSITGKFHNSILRHLNPLSDDDHYPSAAFYREFWNFPQANEPDHSEKAYEVASMMNTVCYQGHQQAFNPCTCQYDIVTLNTGHWGERVYPGCGKVRRGVEKMLQPVTYANASTPMPTSNALDY